MVPATTEFVDVTAEAVSEPVQELRSVQLHVLGRPAVVLTFDRAPDASWFGAVVREVTAC